MRASAEPNVALAVISPDELSAGTAVLGDWDWMVGMNRVRILVAEDESLIAMQLEDVLRELGFDVVGPVSSVKDVVAQLDEDISGALLDVNLRGEAVLAVLPRLKERGVPFIITSGYDAASLFPPEFRNVPRVVKPFDEEELKHLCLSLFGSPNRKAAGG